MWRRARPGARADRPCLRISCDSATPRPARQTPATIADGAAVANAIYNATGVRVRDYPITLDKLIARMPEAV
jgi:hypothetical protein